MKRFSTISVSVLALSATLLVGCEGQQKVDAGQDTTTASSTVVDQTIDVHAVWPPKEAGMSVPIVKNQHIKNYMVVIDTSGSMGDSCKGEEKLNTAKKAALQFIDHVPSDADIGLAYFGGDAEVLVSIDTNNHRNVKEAVSGLEYGGSTPMATGIKLSYDELLRRGAAQLGYGTYELIVLGDGAPDDASTTVHNLDYIVRRTPIAVTTIGFCTDQLEVMKREGVRYFTAQTLDELNAAFESVLAEAETFSDAGF